MIKGIYVWPYLVLIQIFLIRRLIDKCNVSGKIEQVEKINGSAKIVFLAHPKLWTLRLPLKVVFFSSPHGLPHVIFKRIGYSRMYIIQGQIHVIFHQIPGYTVKKIKCRFWEIDTCFEAIFWLLYKFLVIWHPKSI